MLKLKIKKELLPTRCEICHKEDRYEPGFNFCGRCNPSLMEIAFDAIEDISSKEVLYDWQIITLKDVQIIWLKLSLNLFGFLIILSITPALCNFIFSLPSHVLAMIALGIPEVALAFTILVVLFCGKKLPKIIQKIINFISSIFL